MTTARLPVLMYHRVAADGAPATAPWRVAPEAFEQQLAYLRDAGFRSAGLEEWTAAARARTPLPGRRVLLTFDDGYRDFATTAWPLLQRYGFGAAVFVVAGSIGGTNSWDRGYGDTVPLLDGAELRRLRDDGVEIGSHALAHRPLTGLRPEETVAELAGSREGLQRELGVPVTSIAYPFGDVDDVVRHLAGGCGYLTGLCAWAWRATMRDDPLALPRIPIHGTDTFADFVRKVGP